MKHKLNILSIFLATIGSMMVGFLWYDVLFPDLWRDITGINPDEHVEEWFFALASSFLSSIVVAVFLSWFLSRTDCSSAWRGRLYDVIEGIKGGLIIAIFCIGATIWPNYAFEYRKFAHFLLHVGEMTLALVVMGVIIGMMRGPQKGSML